MKFGFSKIAGVSLAMALGLGGCASVNPIVQSEAAPVSFKLGQGGYQTATLRGATPSTLSPIITPDVRREANAERAVPRGLIRDVPVVPAKPVAQPEAKPSVPASDFDKTKVDRELYAHMRIGKRYKVRGKSYTPKHQPKYDVTGTASWYGPKFHGKPTASGEAFDMNGMTAAHKTLPLNSLVHVENVETGASLILRVNDRGPFIGDRIIDLSKGAASKLGLLKSGLKKVRVRYAGPADPNGFAENVKTPMPRVTAEAPEVMAPMTETPKQSASETSAAHGTGGFDLDSYTPLRRMPGLMDAPSASLPAPDLSAPVLPTPMQRMAPAVPQTDFAPLTPVQPNVEDAPLTLTIKGPIHMATSRTIPGAQNIVAASTRK